MDAVPGGNDVHPADELTRTSGYVAWRMDRLNDRGLVMADGEILFTGTCDETAAFVGARYFGVEEKS